MSAFNSLATIGKLRYSSEIELFYHTNAFMPKVSKGLHQLYAEWQGCAVL